MDSADTNYQPSLGDRLPGEYNAPSGSWEECAIRQATVTITMDRRSVQALVKPSLPSVLPPGFVPRKRPAPGIYDVIGAPRSLEDRRAFFSGGPAGYSGSGNSGWGAP